MMNTPLNVGMRRTRGASILALLAAGSVGVWMIFGNPVASSAAPHTNTAGDVNTAAAKLEELHQRVVARTQSADDDDSNSNPALAHAIGPEQAATLAQQVARARGYATTKHSYIELQTRNGRPVYAVKIGGQPVMIDADTGAILN